MHLGEQALKSVFLLIAACLVAVPAFADNDEFVYKMMRSSLDTQLENEGFDRTAIDLVRLVGWAAAQQEICGIGGMKDDVIEFSAKEARVPVKILIDKAVSYMKLDVDRVRSTYKNRELEYCRRLEDQREKSKR
jgi:hypothetical protein